jgi:hypothetical protein
VLALFLRVAIESLVGPDRTTFAAVSPVLPGLVIGAAVFGYPCYRLLRWIDSRLRSREDEVAFKSITPRRL